MSRRKRSAATWAACKQAMRDWPRPGVIALVQELYQLSDDNRRFLHARLLAEDPRARMQALDESKKKLRQMLSAHAIFNNRFRHIDAKRVVDQFAKASDDPAALVELLLTDVEYACEAFSEVRDDEQLADHILITMQRLEESLNRVAPEALPALVEYAERLAQQWGDKFGYGVSDELVGLAEYWQERAGSRSE